MMKTRASDHIAVAWYNRKTFDRIRQFEPDGGGLQDTFEDWLKDAQRVVLELAMRGIRIERINVDPDTLLAFCRAREIKSDSAARAAFVVEVASARDGQKPWRIPERLGSPQPSSSASQ